MVDQELEADTVMLAAVESRASLPALPKGTKWVNLKNDRWYAMSDALRATHVYSEKWGEQGEGKVAGRWVEISG